MRTLCIKVEINFTEFFTIITQNIDFFALYLFGHDHKLDLRIVHLFHEVNIYDAFFAEGTENGGLLVLGETLDMDVVSAPHGPIDKGVKINKIRARGSAGEHVFQTDWTV